jgi:hypothetical protein
MVLQVLVVIAILFTLLYYVGRWVAGFLGVLLLGTAISVAEFVMMWKPLWISWRKEREYRKLDKEHAKYNEEQKKAWELNHAENKRSNQNLAT